MYLIYFMIALKPFLAENPAPERASERSPLNIELYCVGPPKRLFWPPPYFGPLPTASYFGPPLSITYSLYNQFQR
jgi:hypothetical protein